MVAHENFPARLVVQGWLCGRGVGRDDPAGNHDDGRAVGTAAARPWRTSANTGAGTDATAESQRRRHRRRSQEHDGAARHHGAAARAERQRVGAEPRQLRRGARQSVPESARGPDAQERPEGHDAPTLVEAAPARDRRGVRSRSARPRPEERAEGDVDRQPHRERRRSADGRSSARSSSASVDNSSHPDDQRRHPDDARHAGRRDRAGAGDDDVRRPVRHAAGARHAPAGRRAASARAAVHRATRRCRPIRPRPSS